jgi:nitroreductase
MMASTQALDTQGRVAVDNAMRTQRSIRRLKPDPVDDALLLELIGLALEAPTGGGRDYAEFVVVKDRAVKARLARLNRQAWTVYGGVWRVTAGDDAKVQRTIRAVDWQAEHYEEIPTIVVACAKLHIEAGIPSGLRLPAPPVYTNILYGSVLPAVQNLMLAARVRGLGAGLTVMPLWSTILARAALGLPATVTPLAVVPLGWPIGHYGPKARRPAGDAFHLDRYGNQPYKSAE